MTPNQETIRTAHQVLTQQQFTCWALSQTQHPDGRRFSQHEIAITTGLSRRTIRDHLAAADRALANALQNGDPWLATPAGNATPTTKQTSAKSPSSSEQPPPTNANPKPAPAVTPEHSGESQQSGQTSLEQSQEPTRSTPSSRENELAAKPDDE